jgi:lysophospholipase L1-like esterase
MPPTAPGVSVNEHEIGASSAGAAVPVVVFAGDSLTAAGAWNEWFPDVTALNLGINGNTTDDLLDRLGEIIDAQPDEICLLIGTNDLGRRQSVEHLVRNIQLMLVELRRSLPGTRLLLQSIMPRGREFAEQIHEANIHLRQFAATVRAQYLDLWPALAREDGELDPAFTEDRLHLNEAGYQAWLAELRPALVRLRDQPPMSGSMPVVGQSAATSRR